MNARIAAAAITIVATVGGAAVLAQQPSVTLSPAALKEIAEVEAEIDRIEAQTLERLTAAPNNEVQQVELLGKAMLYDKQLSVNRNEACAFCHMPETGFTGPVSELNRTTGSYPGSVRTRFSNRKPQSHAYAPLSPVLHYNPGQADLVGGNFWDMRATGRRLGTPRPSRQRGRPPIPLKWGCPMAPARCTARRSGHIALSSKEYGARRRSPSTGQVMWSRCAISLAHLPLTIRCRSISRSPIAAEPLPHLIRWRWLSLATRLPPR